jgi:hypothetical protein
LIELGEKYEYTAKVYNLLALALVRSGKQANADKIFKAVGELKIIEALETRPLTIDELSFLQNYVRYGPRDKDHETARQFLL